MKKRLKRKTATIMKTVRLTRDEHENLRKIMKTLGLKEFTQFIRYSISGSLEAYKDVE